MDIIAHRAGKNFNPENSLKAMKYASKYTSNIEIDVRRCRTGEIVVIHDPVVEYEDEKLLVDNISLRKLKDITNPSVPTLEESLDVIPSEVKVNIEIKQRGISEDVLRICDSFRNNFVFSSFLQNPLEKINNKETSLLFITGWEENLEKAEKSGFDNLNPVYYLISEGRVKKAHERGFGVYAWTVDDEREARKLKNIGVDGVISNCIKNLD